MERRSRRDGVAGPRRGSLDSDNRPHIFPFKCSISPPKIDLKMASHSPFGAGPSLARRPQDPEVEKLKKENFSLKLRLYLLYKQLSPANVPKDVDMDLTGLDVLKAKDIMLEEAMKTARATEKKLLDSQARVEQLLCDLEAKEKELKHMEGDLQSALKAKDEQIEALENELKQMQEDSKDQEKRYRKSKMIIQTLHLKLNDMSKKFSDGKFTNAAYKLFEEKTRQEVFEDSQDSEMELHGKTHSSSMKEPEKGAERNKGSVSALAEKEKELEERVAQISSYQKELEIKQEAFDSLNRQLKSLSDSHESLTAKLHEKELLVKGLTKELNEMREACHMKDLKLQEAVERCNFADKSAIKQNLGASLKDSVDEKSLTTCTSLEEGTLPLYSEAECSELKDRVIALESQLQDLMNQKSFILSEYHILQQHIEKLARFMEKLIHECSRLSISSDESLITAAFLSEASKCLDRALHLSHCLAQDISSIEHQNFSRLTIVPFSSSGAQFESTRYSVLPKTCAVSAEESTQDAAEGRAHNSAFPVGNFGDATQHNSKRRRRWSTSLYDKPTVNLEFSDFPDICPIDTSEVEDNTISPLDASSNKSGEKLRNDPILVTKPRMCWDVVGNPSHQLSIDLLNTVCKNYSPLKEARLSSDSDIWSEPDRDLSIQRVGIQMEKPVQSPLPRRSRSRSTGTDHRMDNSSLAQDRTLGHMSPADCSGYQTPATPSTDNSKEKYMMRRQVECLQQKVERLESEMSNYKKLFEIKKNTVERLTAENLRLVEHLKIEQMKKFTETCVQTEDEDITISADTMCQELQEELKSLKGKLKTMCDKCSSYEQEIASLKNEKENLVSQNESLEHALGFNKQTMDDVHARYQKVNALWKEEQQKCSNLIAENTSLKHIVEELKNGTENEWEGKYAKAAEMEVSKDRSIISENGKENMQPNIKACDLTRSSEDASCVPTSDSWREAGMDEHDNEIFSLKCQVSDLRRKLHKTTWKKDFFLVTKTVLIERLKAEVKQKDELISKLTAECNIPGRNLPRDLIGEHTDKCPERIHKSEGKNENQDAANERLEEKLLNSYESIKKLTTEIKEKDAEMEKMAAKFEMVESLLTEKESESRVLTSKVQSHVETAHTLAAELETKESTIKALNVLLQDYNGSTKSLKRQISDLQQREKLMKAEKKELVNSISRYTVEIQDIQSQLLQLQKQLEGRDACQQRMETQLSDLQQQLDVKNNKLIHVEKQCDELKKANEKLVETMHDKMKHEEKITTLESQISSLENDLNKERKISTQSSEQKCCLEKQLADKDKVIEALSKDKEAAEVQLQKLVDHVSVMKEKQTELEMKMVELHQEMLEKESQIANLSNDNETLYSSLSEAKKAELEIINLENVITTLETTLKSKCIIINDLKQKLDAGSKVIHENQEDLTEKSDQIRKLETMLQEYSKRNEQQSLNLEKQLKQIANYENELSKVYEQLNHMKYDMDAKDKAIEKYKAETMENKGVIDNLKSNYETKKQELGQLHSKHQKCLDLASEHLKITGSANSKNAAVQADIPERLSPSKDNFSKLQQQLMEAKMHILSLRSAINHLDDENTSLKKQLADYDGMVETLSEQRNVSSETIVCLRKRVESLEQEVKTKLMKKLLFSESCIKHLNEEKQKLVLQNDEHEHRILELQAMLRTTESELCAAQNMCKKKNTHIAELEKELGKMRIIEQLESVYGSDVLSQLMASGNGAKFTDMEELTTACTARLKSKLDETSSLADQLKKDLSSQEKLVETLKTDLAAETERKNNLELELRKRQESKSDEDMRAAIYHKSMIKRLEEKLLQKSKLIKELQQKVSDRSCELNAGERLIIEQAETVNNLKRVISEMNDELKSLRTKKSYPAQETGSVREEVLNEWSNRKWWLQNSMLQIQRKIFKDIPLAPKEHSILFDHLAALNSKIAPVSVKKDPSSCNSSSQAATEAEKQRFLLTLQADCAFLKNIRHLMKYFVTPLAKHYDYSAIAEMLARVPRQVEVYQGLLDTWHVGSHSSDFGKPREVHHRDDRSSPPFAVPPTSIGLEPEQMYIEGNLQSGPVSPRSDYSSPDLGIESDVNQDAVIQEHAEGSRVGRSKELRDSQPSHTREDKWTSSSQIHAIAVLKDYELLRKEVQECVVGLKTIMFRANEGLKTLNGNASPRKLLEQSTLKSILDCCNHVEMCLSQVENLVNQFWYGPYPHEGDPKSYRALMHENSELKISLERAIAQLKEKDATFQELMNKEDAKKRHISKQLVDTKKILRMSKAVLERQLGQFH